ncbi:MAG: DUF3795 domain-containing protein [Desulfovibrionaceae bacterium]
MDYESIKKVIAPCGLSCGKCIAFAGGPVQEHAAALRTHLGSNFAFYAERFKNMDPVFAGYPAFAPVLDFLASGTCTGCRGSGCLFKACAVPACAGKRGVDFCFQCVDFPCTTHGMPPAIAGRWQKNNEIMRDKGVETLYELMRDAPRYP